MGRPKNTEQTEQVNVTFPKDHVRHFSENGLSIQDFCRLKVKEAVDRGITLAG
jgi:hypothetical protein